jgi:hypothetical protein
MTTKRLSQALLLASALVVTARAEDSTNKTDYTLLNPVPAALMREWHTDHAGVSPYTVDAGHYEADIYALQYQQRDDTYRNPRYYALPPLVYAVGAWTYGAMNLKAGLLNNLDAEVTIVPYETVTQTWKGIGLNERSTSSGFGDTTARLKLNVWGDDGKTTALSVSGVVKFPTAADNLGSGLYEGGPSIEFAARLPYGFELRVDSAVMLDQTSDWNAAFENLLSVSHRITGNLEGFCVFDTVTYATSGNLFMIIEPGPHGLFVGEAVKSTWSAVIEPGLNYRLKENVELFALAGFGVNGAVYDYNPAVGIDVRF